MTPHLENRRENSDPKCATCREWDGRDTSKPVGTCERHKVTTLDLAVCTAWQLHEVLHGQIMRSVDE